MSLAIFEGTYLLGELKSKKDREKIKTCVKVAVKMPDSAFSYSKYHYLQYSEKQHFPMFFEICSKNISGRQLCHRKEPGQKYSRLARRLASVIGH